MFTDKKESDNESEKGNGKSETWKSQGSAIQGRQVGSECPSGPPMKPFKPPLHLGTRNAGVE